MRWLAAGALGLLVGTSFGCDRIFGIHDTKLIDGGESDGQPDAQYLAMRVTGMVLAKAIPGGQDVIDFPADGITVQYGALDGELHDAAVAADGTFLIPPELPDATYRIVYHVPGEPPTEVQSRLRSAHFVGDPLWGRLPRTPAPLNAGITFQPSGAPASLPNARVMTIGRWTQTDVGVVSGTSYGFLYSANALSMSGPLATLEGAEDDREILLSYASAGGITSAQGYMTAKIAMLSAATFTPAPGAWKTTTSETTSSAGSDALTATQRLDNSLGSLTRTPRTVSLAGAIPSVHMPGFTSGTPGANDAPATARPPMVMRLYEETGATNPHDFANPFNGTDAPALPLVEMRGAFVDHQVTSGPKLTSGFETLVPVQDGNPNAVTIQFPVGVARNVSLGGVALKDSDGKQVPGSAFIDLKFDTDRAVDYCMVTVNRLNGAVLVPVRRYLIIAPSLATVTRVDGSQFQAGMTHALRIDCFAGYDDAAIAMGDFTQVSYTPDGFAMSTLFPTTFTVQ